MAHPMIIWGLRRKDWSQARAVVIEHGNRGFSRLWKVTSRALLCVESEYDLRYLAGSGDGSIEFEEEADATWCAACFPSLSAADACAADLHGVLIPFSLLIDRLSTSRLLTSNKAPSKQPA